MTLESSLSKRSAGNEFPQPASSTYSSSEYVQSDIRNTHLGDGYDQSHQFDDVELVEKTQVTEDRYLGNSCDADLKIELQVEEISGI